MRWMSGDSSMFPCQSILQWRAHGRNFGACWKRSRQIVRTVLTRISYFHPEVAVGGCTSLTAAFFRSDSRLSVVFAFFWLAGLLACAARGGNACKCRMSFLGIKDKTVLSVPVCQRDGKGLVSPYRFMLFQAVFIVFACHSVF